MINIIVRIIRRKGPLVKKILNGRGSRVLVIAFTYYMKRRMK